MDFTVSETRNSWKISRGRAFLKGDQGLLCRQRSTGTERVRPQENLLQQPKWERGWLGLGAALGTAGDAQSLQSCILGSSCD